MEEALLSDLGKLIIGLLKKFQQELSLASDDEKELQGLIDWRRVIMNFLEKASSVEVIDESYKAGIEKMREFVSDSQSAIDNFMKSGPEGNAIPTSIANHINRRNFTVKATDAKHKLATSLNNLKMVVDALQPFHQLPDNHAQSSSAAYPSSSIAYPEETCSVIKSPPGDSGLTQEGDLVRLHRHKERLIESLRKVNSGTMDVPEILDDSLLCLLYLSIFPENSEISCKRVSRLWAAEGLLTNLRKAEVFLNDLLDRKYIHRVKERTDGELSTFRLDDSVREIIASFSDLLSILKITNEGSKNSSERVRRLSVQGGIVTDLNEEKLSQLDSLFVFNVSSNKNETTTSKASLSGNSENSLFPFNFKRLKVLDLTGAPLHIAPDALFELFLLRYLSLRDTSIKKISGLIGGLKHLEFLDLKHSFVTELPEEVGVLEKICHILIYHHEKDPLMESYNLIGFKALCSVGGLKRLEKLCFVESDDSILKDLGNLTKLTRLGITNLRKEHGKGLCTSLKELKKLESLNLHAFDEDEILDVNYLSSPPQSLKRLYLHGRLDKLPNWISPRCHLTKIVLRWSCLKGATRQNEESHMEAAAQQEKESHLEAATQQEEDLLATLGKLPELVELELRRAYNGRQLDFKNGQFPKLKILLLDELGRLISMSLAEGTMPRLEDLTISRCPWLEGIPTGIEHIPTLQALEFFDMSREFYEMIQDDYRNSEGKPKVYFTQWRPGQWKTIPLVLDGK